MNMKEYYASMSRVYLHQIILCVTVLLLILLSSLYLGKLVPMMIGLIIVSIFIIYYFFRYLYFLYKSSSLPKPTYLDLQSESLLLIPPSPVTAYQWNIFSSHGFRFLSIKIGKQIVGKRKIKTLTIYNHKENSSWTVENHGQFIDIHSSDLNRKFFKREKKEYCANENERYLINDYGSTFSITKNGTSIMTVTKGIMPIRIQQIFPLNTPIIQFQSTLPEEERYFCLALFFYS